MCLSGRILAWTNSRHGRSWLAATTALAAGVCSHPRNSSWGHQAGRCGTHQDRRTRGREVRDRLRGLRPATGVRGRRRVSDSESERCGACRCCPAVPPPGGRDARGGSGEDGGRRPLGDVRGAVAGGALGQSPRAILGSVTVPNARVSSTPSSSRRLVRLVRLSGRGLPGRLSLACRPCRPGGLRTSILTGRAATSASDT